MNRHAGRLVALLLFPGLLAACGLSPQSRTARLLDNRLQTRLAQDISGGRAVVQPLADGARVTLLDPSPFPNNPMTLDDRRPDLRPEVIEGMLDPSLMRVQVADTTALPADRRETRVRNVQEYFTDNGLAEVLQPSGLPAATSQAGAAPAGLNITISVYCPPADRTFGYTDGRSKPVCE